MSDYRSNDPFVTPGPDGQQWQGTPVPMAPLPLPPTMPPAMSPQQPYQIPPPPMPQNPAYATVAYPPVPPAGYLYAANYNAANTAKNWMGITSLALSAASIIFGITCIPGVILGHMGLSAAKRGEANNRGLALAGVIVGWVFLGFGLLFFGFIVIAMAMDTSTT